MALLRICHLHRKQVLAVRVKANKIWRVVVVRRILMTRQSNVKWQPTNGRSFITARFLQNFGVRSELFKNLISCQNLIYSASTWTPSRTRGRSGAHHISRGQLTTSFSWSIIGTAADSTLLTPDEVTTSSVVDCHVVGRRPVDEFCIANTYLGRISYYQQQFLGVLCARPVTAGGYRTWTVLHTFFFFFTALSHSNSSAFSTTTQATDDACIDLMRASIAALSPMQSLCSI